MPYGRIEPSGCTERYGLVQVRLSMCLEEGDARYSDPRFYVINPDSMPFKRGYQGLIDADGRPLDLEAYAAWESTLPRVWLAERSFHNHFIYLDPYTLRDEQITEAIEHHLPNFYKAWCDGWDAVPGGMRHGWDVACRKPRPTRFNKTQPELYVARRSECLAKADILKVSSFAARATGQGETFPATEITTGAAAINRATSEALFSGSAHTLISTTLAAADSGSIDTVEMYVTSYSGSPVVTIGTFYNTVSSTYVCRDAQEWGTISATGFRSVTGLDVDIESGDYIGASADTTCEIDKDYGGGSMCAAIGAYTVVDASNSYGCESHPVSLYGTGETAAEDQTPTVTTSAGDDITTTSFTANGNITATGGVNPYRRGFAYAEELKYMLSFDGVDDYVTVPHDSSLTIAKLTVEAWVYLKRDGSGVTALPRIATKEGEWSIYVNGDYKVTFQHFFSDTAGQWSTTSANTLPANQWAKVKIVYDSGNVANDPTITINGVSLAVTEESTPVGTASTSTDPLRIGDYISGTIRPWEGYLAEVKISDDGTLVSYWDFSEGSGSAAADSESSNDGTIVGAVHAYASWDLMPLYVQQSDTGWLNEAFEDGSPPTNWSAIGTNTVARDTDEYQGTYALKGTRVHATETRVGEAGTYILNATTHALIAGAKYSLSIWVKGVTVGGNGARVRVDWRNSAGSTISYSSSSYRTATSYGLLEVLNAEAPALCTGFRVFLIQANQNDVFLWDSLIIVEGESIPAVFDDGDFSTGTYSDSITGLTPGSTYRVRAFAVNSEGISYGTVVAVETAETYTTSPSLDALLKALDSTSVNLDAYLRATDSQTIDLDTLLRQTDDVSILLDVIVGLLASSTTIDIDALLRGLVSLGVDVSALLRDTDSQTVDLDALIAEIRSITVSLSALLRQSDSGAIELDVLLRGTAAQMVDLSALLKKADSVGISLDAIAVDRLVSAIDLDALLRDTDATTITLDTLIGLAQDVSVSLDTILVQQYVNAPFYIEVRDPEGNLLGTIKDIIGGTWEQATNVPDVLSFDIPLNELRAEYITRKNELWVRDAYTDEVVSICKLQMGEDSD